MPSFVHRLTTEKRCAGTAHTVVAAFQLPAGSYIVRAKADISGGPVQGLFLWEYRLVVGSAEDHGSHQVRAIDDHPIHLVVGANLTTASTAQFIVNTNGSIATVNHVVLTAESVESLTMTEAEGDPPTDL